MAKKVIVVDDFTDKAIEGTGVTLTVSLTLNVNGQDETWTSSDNDVAENTALAFKALVENNDVATFIGRLNKLVSAISADDTDRIRKWAKEAHPEFNVGDKGRLGAEVIAAYRREVINASPSNAGGRENGTAAPVSPPADSPATDEKAHKEAIMGDAPVHNK